MADKGVLFVGVLPVGVITAQLQMALSGGLEALREAHGELAVDGYADLPLMEDLDLSRRLSRLGRIRFAHLRVQVSGRRFLEAPVRYTAMVNAFPALWRLGVPAATLARWYRHVR